MGDNVLRTRGTFDDDISGKLDRVRDTFDKVGGPGSSASFFGNITAKGVAKGFELVGSAAHKATEFLFDSIDAASNLQQTVGGLESVFGDAQGPIVKFAETAADKAGLSKRAVFEMATIIGAQLKNMGFDATTAAGMVVDLEQKAADLAATFGGSTADAISAISALLRGERDPIERYGVSINEATIKAYELANGLGTSTDAAKTASDRQAVLALLYDQTAAAAGKFASETDTLAGKQAIANARMEDAQAKLGTKLLPIMERLSDFLINVGIPAIDGFADALDGVGDIVESVNSGIQKLLGREREFRNMGNFRDLGPADPNSGFRHMAGGGWAGVNGPELAVLGDGGEPELVTPRSQLPTMAPSSGVTLVGVTEADILDMVDRGLYFKLRRASPIGGRV